jgi:hypothetical protein
MIVFAVSGANHRQNHLEPLQRFERVRLLCRQENHLTAMQAMRLAGNADFHFAFEHMHERVERSRVLTQALSFVECEDRHVTGRFLDNLAADFGAVLVIHQVGGLRDFATWEPFEFGRGFWLQYFIVSVGSVVGDRTV